ncbi:hypothetical protein LTR78_002405 [Recurvomyces mirabilis]|uniref:Uncharacterized protein n=1 Tax=Recurvomyces mirabilis TaxID=574656 RepID=A0AAE0WTZ0_9PEZI|nr:hypothetical protein LTR78_002405 [Recurvomyces mirabilis]KAK5157334.1 hypothetical protein LTS14_004099 [Recurvomyces mirabilis]
MGFISTLLAIMAISLLATTAAPLASPQAAGAVSCFHGGDLAPKSDITAVINEFCRLFKDNLFEMGPHSAGETYQYNGNSIYIGSDITEAGGPFNITTYHCVDYLTSVQIQCASSQSGSVVTDHPAGAFFMTVNPPTQLGPTVERRNIEVAESLDGVPHTIATPHEGAASLPSRTIKAPRNDPAAATCADPDGMTVTDDQAREAYSSFCNSASGHKNEAASSFNSTFDVSGITIKMEIHTGQFVPCVLNADFCSSSYDKLVSSCSDASSGTTHGGSWSVGDRGLSFSLEIVSNPFTKRDDTDPVYCVTKGNQVFPGEAITAYAIACDEFDGYTIDAGSSYGSDYEVSGKLHHTILSKIWAPRGAPYKVDKTICTAAFDQLMAQCPFAYMVSGGTIKMGPDDVPQFSIIVDDNFNSKRDSEVDAVFVRPSRGTTLEKRGLPVGVHCAKTGPPFSISTAQDIVSNACSQMQVQAVVVNPGSYWSYRDTSGPFEIDVDLEASPKTHDVFDYGECLEIFGILLDQCVGPLEQTLGGIYSYGSGEKQFLLLTNADQGYDKREVEVNAVDTRRNLPAGVQCAHDGYPLDIQLAQDFINRAVSLFLERPKWEPVGSEWSQGEYVNEVEVTIKLKASPDADSFFDYGEIMTNFKTLISMCKSPDNQFFGRTYSEGPNAKEFILEIGNNNVPTKRDSKYDAPFSKREQLPHGPNCAALDSSNSASINDVKSAILQACDEFAGYPISAGYHITDAVPLPSSNHVFIMSILAPMGSDMVVDRTYCRTSFQGILQECINGQGNTPGGTWSWGEGETEYVMGLDTNVVPPKRALATVASQPDTPACAATGGPSVDIRDVKVIIQSYCNVAVAFPVYPDENVYMPWDIDGGHIVPQIKSANSQPANISSIAACTMAFDTILSSCADANAPGGGSFTGGSLKVPANSLEYVITVNDNNLPSKQQLESTGRLDKIDQDPFYICTNKGQSYPQDQAQLAINSFCWHNCGLTVEAGCNQTNMYGFGSSHLILQVLAVDDTSYTITADICGLAFADVLNNCDDSTAHTINGGAVYYPPHSVTNIIRTEDIPPPPPPPEKRLPDETVRSDGSLMARSLPENFYCTKSGARSLPGPEVTLHFTDFCNRAYGQVLAQDTFVYNTFPSSVGVNLVVGIKTPPSAGEEIATAQDCIDSFTTVMAHCTNLLFGTFYGGVYSSGSDAGEFILDIEGNTITSKRGLREHSLPKISAVESSIVERILPENYYRASSGQTVTIEHASQAAALTCDLVGGQTLEGNHVYLNYYTQLNQITLQIQVRTAVGYSGSIDTDTCALNFAELISRCAVNKDTLYGGTLSFGVDSLEIVVYVEGNTIADKRDDLTLGLPGLPADTTIIQVNKFQETELRAIASSGQNITVRNANDAVAHFCAMIDEQPLTPSQVYINWYTVGGLVLEVQIHAGTGEQQSIGNDICLLNFGVLIAKCSDGGIGDDPFQGGVEGTGVGSIELVLHIEGNSDATGQSSVGRRRRDLAAVKTNIVQANSLQQNELRTTPTGTTKCYTSNFGAQSDEITPMITDFCHRYGNKYIASQKATLETYATASSSGPSWVGLSNYQPIGDWYYLDTGLCLEVFEKLVDDCSLGKGDSNKPGGTYTLEGGKLEFVLNINPASPI